MYGKGYIWNLATCSCENVRYTERTVEVSVITCDKDIGTTKSITKTIPTKSAPENFNEKTLIGKIKNSYILLAFLLITVKLLIAFTIYCCIIKYRSKQKHL